MDTSLLDLLYRVGDEASNSSYTHMLLAGEGKKWSIKANKYNEFWSKYCQLVGDYSPSLYLAERPTDTLPIMTKCRIRFNKDSKSDILFGNNFILQFVSCHQQLITELIKLSDAKLELVACYLCSETSWMEDNMEVIEIMVQFPYCRVDRKYQKEVFRPRLIQDLKACNIISKLPRQPEDDWGVMFSCLDLEKPIPMYGSKEKVIQSRLILEEIYSYITQHHIDNEEEPVYELDVFRPNHHSHVVNNLVQGDMFKMTEIGKDNEDKYTEFWLPAFLSIYYSPAMCHPKEEKLRVDKCKSSNISPENKKSKTDLNVERAHIFLPMVSADRSNIRGFCMDIGKALYTIHGGGDDGLYTWIKFCQKGEALSDDECESLYDTFEDNHITLHTLAWYAREDSFDHYNEWHKNWCVEAFRKASSGLDADVIEAIWRCFWLEHVCSSIEKNTWYAFNQNKWRRQDAANRLYDSIQTNFLSKIENYRTQISRSIQESMDENYRASNEIEMKKLTRLIYLLKRDRQVEAYIKASRRIFYKEKFNEIKDTNVYVMGMVDCVLEACQDEILARPGKPEDFVTMTTGKRFPRGFNWNHSQVKKVMKWMRQVFRQQDLRDYFLKYMSSFFIGKNLDKIFVVFTGKGNNSKSMIAKLIHLSFGEYIKELPVSVISARTSNPGNANPEIFRMKNARGALMAEPDEDVAIKAGPFKRISAGTDKIFARDLHDSGADMDITFKPILMCNEIPPIIGAKEAEENRFRGIPFLSTWKVDAPEDEEDQFDKGIFKMDSAFDDQIPSMASAFLWVLTQYFKKYRAEGLVEPDIIKKTNREYFDSNNIFAHYLSDKVIEALDEKGHVDTRASLTVQEMYESFKKWYISNYPNMKIPSSKDFRSEMLKKIGSQKRVGGRNVWEGFRLVGDEAISL